MRKEVLLVAASEEMLQWTMSEDRHILSSVGFTVQWNHSGKQHLRFPCNEICFLGHIRAFWLFCFIVYLFWSIPWTIGVAQSDIVQLIISSLDVWAPKMSFPLLGYPAMVMVWL